MAPGNCLQNRMSHIDIWATVNSQLVFLFIVGEMHGEGNTEDLTGLQVVLQRGGGGSVPRLRRSAGDVVRTAPGTQRHSADKQGPQAQNPREWYVA